MRVALVTGAARGIGAATVAALCADDYLVTAVDAGITDLPGVAYPLADIDDLQEIAARFPGQVVAVPADVRDPAALARAVAVTCDRFGHLDAAVAAAGVISGGHRQWDTPAEHVRTLFEVNVMGVWNLAAAVMPVMVAGDNPSQCRFVAVASTAAERGLYGLSGYCASKHAVVGLVRGLAADLVGTGVTAVAVSPGSTRTAMLAATADLYQVSVEELASHQGLRRVIEPEEIAAVIALCCSPAGAVLHGSVVNADGGFAG